MRSKDPKSPFLFLNVLVVCSSIIDGIHVFSISAIAMRYR